MDCEDGDNALGMAQRHDERDLPTEGPCWCWASMDHLHCSGTGREKRERKESPQHLHLGQYNWGHLFIKLCIFKLISVHTAVVRRERTRLQGYQTIDDQSQTHTAVRRPGTVYPRHRNEYRARACSVPCTCYKAHALTYLESNYDDRSFYR